jgi:hypothetical protein
LDESLQAKNVARRRLGRMLVLERRRLASADTYSRRREITKDSS